MRKRLLRNVDHLLSSCAPGEEVISGGIINLTSNVIDNSYTNKDTGKYVEAFENTVRIEIRYDVILTSNNKLFTSKTYSGSDTATGTLREVSNQAEIVAKGLVNQQLKDIVKVLAPYTVTEYRSLANDELKDPRMENAKKLVQDGFYKKAADVYTKVYSETQNFAAGFNASIMKEILGNLEGAMADMETLADVSSNVKALTEFKRMSKTLEESKAAEAQK